MNIKFYPTLPPVCCYFNVVKRKKFLSFFNFNLLVFNTSGDCVENIIYKQYKQ